MDAYEIRLELLKMAQSSIEHARSIEYSRKEATWIEHNRINVVEPTYKQVSPEEINEYAERLNQFISQKPNNKVKTYSVNVITEAFASIGYEFDFAGNLITPDEHLLETFDGHLLETFDGLYNHDNNQHTIFHKTEGFIPLNQAK